MVSFAALRWLADQNASFVMLERDGTVLVTTAPVRSSDSRLRRAQALAFGTGAALQLATELIGQKLASQERVARDRLRNVFVADTIAQFRIALGAVNRLEAVLSIEATAALTYWSAWAELGIRYPKSDLSRVPDHWRSFGARMSPITKSPRLAANPPNAVLNYLYAILESEARLAAAELGLDPGLGVLHRDAPNRDSLACDLMEPVRPLVDAYLFDWVSSGPLRREWFFEQSNGNCRLMGSFATKLSETALIWRRAIAPYAERAAKILWQGRSKRSPFNPLPTRLTQSMRSRAERPTPTSTTPVLPKPRPRCGVCGGTVTTGSRYCFNCVPIVNRENLLAQAKLGRIATHSATAEARRSATQRKQFDAIRNWNPSELPDWLNEKAYRREILPRLSKLTVKTIRVALDVSHPYATNIRRGTAMPHPRHWVALAKLAGVMVNSQP
jgi:CRISPR-associated endonuclease Cas1